MPSLWEGTYVCPDGNSQTVKMNVTQREADNILTTAVLAFGGISLTASGTYGYGTLFIQNNQKDLNKTSVILHVNQQSNNLTTMKGELTINRNKCQIVLNMQKCEYIDDLNGKVILIILILNKKPYKVCSLETG